MNVNKTRYRADSLIHYLSRVTAKGHLTIGLTSKDISTTKNEHADWGVMGLGFCPGKSCIASTFRLKGNNKLEKLYKVAIHELGHTQGLPHCPVKTCLMRDAEGKDHLNEETGFCASCKAVLIKAGWDLR
ncbi:MAG: matrixin family metalloprotease [Bacteroidetes bacterium]|nr:matrixin family metalloprotease [Bacteroidota bacterium]